MCHILDIIGCHISRYCWMLMFGNIVGCQYFWRLSDVLFLNIVRCQYFGNLSDIAFLKIVKLDHIWISYFWILLVVFFWKIIIIITIMSCHQRGSPWPSLSSITSDRSSRLHPVSAQSCCMSVLAGHPAFARPCEGVHRSTSLMILRC